MPLEELDPVSEIWGFCAMGVFSGHFPGKDAVRKLSLMWKVPTTFHFHSSGWIIFNFANEHDRDQVVSPGHYNLFGCQMLIRKILPYFNFDVAEMCVVSVWITLPNLPLEYLSAKPLSRIASQVGTPITTDQLTRERARCSCARVLVSIDVSKPLVRSIPLVNPDGNQVTQKIVYEIEP